MDDDLKARLIRLEADLDNVRENFSQFKSELKEKLSGIERIQTTISDKLDQINSKVLTRGGALALAIVAAPYLLKLLGH